MVYSVILLMYVHVCQVVLLVFVVCMLWCCWIFGRKGVMFGLWKYFGSLSLSITNDWHCQQHGMLTPGIDLFVEMMIGHYGT